MSAQPCGLFMCIEAIKIHYTGLSILRSGLINLQGSCCRLCASNRLAADCTVAAGMPEKSSSCHKRAPKCARAPVTLQTVLLLLAECRLRYTHACKVVKLSQDCNARARRWECTGNEALSQVADTLQRCKLRHGQNNRRKVSATRLISEGLQGFIS